MRSPRVPRSSIHGLLRVAVVAAFSVSALTAFAFLVVHDPVSDLVEHLPGTDGAPADRPPAPKVRIGQYREVFGGVPSAITASWPGFRGALRDSTSRESAPWAAPRR